MLQLIQDVFFYDKHHAECLLMDVLACVRQKNLVRFLIHITKQTTNMYNNI
jgi:hypothetical protein